MTKPEPSELTLRRGRLLVLLVEEIVEELLERRALGTSGLRCVLLAGALQRLGGGDVDHGVLRPSATSAHGIRGRARGLACEEQRERPRQQQRARRYQAGRQKVASPWPRGIVPAPSSPCSRTMSARHLSANRRGLAESALLAGMRLAANEPDDSNAGRDGHGAGHAQSDSGSAGAGLEQLSSDARSERPQQPFDHEHQAKGNDKIAHGAAGKVY